MVLTDEDVLRAKRLMQNCRNNQSACPDLRRSILFSGIQAKRKEVPKFNRAEYMEILIKTESRKVVQFPGYQSMKKLKPPVPFIPSGIASENEVRLAEEQIEKMKEMHDQQHAQQKKEMIEAVQAIKQDALNKIKETNDQQTKEILDKTEKINTQQTEKIIEKVKVVMQDALDEIENMNVRQKNEIVAEILMGIKDAYRSIDGKRDDEFEKEYHEFLRTKDKDWAFTLELSIPILKQLGFNVSAKFNVKKWADKMYKKYGLKIFKYIASLFD